MNQLHDAIRIYRSSGPLELGRRLIRYLHYVVSSKAWRWYYRVKSAVVRNDVVVVNGVSVDTGVGLSPDVVSKLRTRRYETDETALIDAYVRPDLPVIDLGAGIGYTSTLAETRLDPGIPILAVEANPTLVPVLERTRELNGRSFEIVHAAYSSTPGGRAINLSTDVLSSSTVRQDPDGFDGTVEVDSVTLEQVMADHDVAGPIQLFVDVEGSECELIDHEMAILRRTCRLLLVEFHPSLDYDVHAYVDDLLDNGFELAETRGDVYLFTNRSSEV